MKKLILLLLFPFLLHSQNFPELDQSPMDKAHFSRQNEVATITYSRPQLKGRVLKDILKLNKIWRTGANEANELLLNVDIEILKFLNPQYKLNIIPFVKDKNYVLTLPINAVGNFVSNEKQIYAYVDVQEEKREKTLPKYVEINSQITYRVRSGDFLGKIANKYRVSVSNLKRWNNLKSNNLRVGQRLRIYTRNPSVAVAKTSTSTSKTAKVVIPKGGFNEYTVISGDSLWKISQKYVNVSVQNIKEWNNIWSVKSLKPGTKLKIFNK